MLSSVILILATLISFGLAGIVLLNNSKLILNRVYALLVLVTAFWGGVVFLEDTVWGRDRIGALANLDYGFAVLMVAFFFWFCQELTEHHARKAQVASWFLAATTLALLATGYVVHARLEGPSVVLAPEAGFVVFIGYLLVYVAYGLALLWRKYRHSTGRLHVQIRYVGLGLVLTILGVLVADVIVPRLFNVTGAYITRAGIYSTLLFSSFSMYAILKHRFMDVKLLVARSIAYALLLLALAAVYGVGLLGASSVFFQENPDSLAKGLTYTALGVALAFTFQPLRRFFEKVTDSVFYRERYDSQVVLNDFTQILVSELHLERMLNKSLTALCEKLHIQFGQIIVFNNDRVYRIEHYGPLPRRLMVAPELRTLNHAMIVADELEGGEHKTLLETHGIRVSMMLSTREEFVGYLLLGDKLSGDVYSNQDVELLEIITKELAVAVLNAKAYAEIQDFNLTLQARVDHATNRLRVANRHLKELDRAKDEFISMASHQLRTPLTTIKGYLSMLLEGDAGRITPGQKEFVNYAFQSSERMVNLISDLLNVSRLSAGRFLIQTKPTDMVAMIEDEVRQLQNHAKAKDLALIFERPKHALPPAEIDDGKTRQVVMNFIDNAIYYTQKGEVRVMLQQTGDHVRLEVRDTGIGVPQDARKKLFSKFYRADNAQIVRPDGTGLGLYLAKRVVEDQGGTIIFNSVEGKGSTFGFELPFKPRSIKHEGKNHDRQPIHKQ